MTHETFKALYEIQEAIGNLIDATTKNQDGSKTIVKLISIAKEIGEQLGTKENHWMKEPISLEDAWTNYIKY